MKMGGRGPGGSEARIFFQRVTHTKIRKLSGFGPLFSWKWGGDYPPRSKKWGGRVPPSPLWPSPCICWWLHWFVSLFSHVKRPERTPISSATAHSSHGPWNTLQWGGKQNLHEQLLTRLRVKLAKDLSTFIPRRHAMMKNWKSFRYSLRQMRQSVHFTKTLSIVKQCHNVIQLCSLQMLIIEKST